MAWYRNDKAVVAEALRRGERPDLATTMASGPLDELVALHQALGIFALVDELEVQRTRAGIDDELLLRTLATLPFVEQASLSGASEVLFREPALLLHLGWAPLQIRQGSNGRQRQPELGSAPAVLYVAGCYGVFSLEEVLDVLGSAPRESLLPALTKPSAPAAPT